jgi:hypothetical protein
VPHGIEHARLARASRKLGRVAAPDAPQLGSQCFDQPSGSRAARSLLTRACARHEHEAVFRGDDRVLRERVA